MGVKGIKATFVGKKTINLITTTDQSRLTYEQRLAYSVLACGLDSGRGYRASVLAAESSLHESQTVPRAIAALRERGLVEEHDGLLYAVKPSGEIASWFRFFESKRDGSRTLAYTKSLCPSSTSPLTQRQTALLSLLWSLADERRTVKGVTYAFLATLLPASRKTVADGCAVLRKAFLIYVVPSTRDRSTLGFRLLTPTTETLLWFRDTDQIRHQGDEEYPGLYDDAPTVEDMPLVEGPPPDTMVQDANNPDEDDEDGDDFDEDCPFVRSLRAKDFDDDQVSKCLMVGRGKGLTLTRWRAMLDDADARKYAHLPNCFGLFYSRLKRLPKERVKEVRDVSDVGQ